MTTLPPTDPLSSAAPIGSVSDRFAEIVASHGDRLALSSPSLSATYRELADLVSLRAAGVSDRVAGSGVPIAVMAAHDGPLVVALLGVIASGHAVLVLDPMAPPSQTAAIVEESATPLVLHDEDHADAVRSVLDALDGAPPESALLDDVVGERRPAPPLRPDSAAMLAFTSGTSERPKGAIITHGVLMNLVSGASRTLGIGPEDRMPMLFPLSMAVAAYPLFLPLLNGGTLATLDVRSEGFAPVGPFLADERITLAYLAPTVVRFLADALGGRTFPELRMVALGGEGVDREAVELTKALFGPDEIGLGYGTTETGVVSLGVLPGNGDVPADVSCGSAVPGIELYILGPDGEALPRGEAGEVGVASAHLFRGYLGHPELDDRCFAADPGDRSGWRLYRTGDHGRISEDGSLFVLGRIDTTVKVRGRFVVLGDVEAALNELDDVNGAIVTPVRISGITELVAVVATGGRPARPQRWRARLLETREAFRVPSRWIEVDDLPRLPNGKADRRAAAALAETAISAPATPLSPAVPDRVVRELTDIWRSLLPAHDLGPETDYFHAGGDSLSAAQMLIRVEQRLGVTIPAGRLVHARTLGELAAVVRDLDVDTGAATVVQDSISGRPRLWFVPDLQGSAFRVRHLAAALGPDQPVWSFESPLLRGDPNPYEGLEEFAAGYTADLLAAQPAGPYWLAGYSFGGVCAYEMARQLVRVGHDVAFVGVVDVGPSYRGPGWHGDRSPFRPWFGVAKPPEPGASVAQRVRHYREMAADGPGRVARHLMVRSGVSRIVDPYRFRRDLEVHGRVRPAWRLWYAWEEHWKLASRAWDRDARYDGVVDLFWADRTPAGDDTMGWGPLVGELRIHRFGGEHFGILEERGASELAGSLRRAIDAELHDRETG